MLARESAPLRGGTFETGSGGRVVSELIVHEIPAAWGLPSAGPFCLKLETHLRMVGLPYRAVYDPTPFRGPKGKLPWIEHEGRKIGDSGFIIDYLNERFGLDADRSLSAAERGVALSLRRLIEENLYWTLVYDRWVAPENWALTKSVVLGLIPVAVRPLIAPIARRGVRRQLAGHGIGLHARDEIHAIGRRDVDALAGVLGEKPFLLGETATSVDASAYGVLANIMDVPIASPVKDEALGRANLVAYVARMRERYFPPPGRPTHAMS
jgi:glutathione S-transferase